MLLKDFGIYTASLKNEFKIGKVVDALGAEAVEKGALALVRAAFAVTAGGSLVANRGQRVQVGLELSRPGGGSRG